MAKKASSRESATGKGKKTAKPASSGGASVAGKAKAARNVKAARSKTKAKPARKPLVRTASAAAKAAKAAKPAKATKPGKPARPAKPAKKAPPAMKTKLSTPELKEFRALLLAKRRELVGDMTGIEAEALGADRQESKGDISDHPADAGTDNFEQEFSLGLLESERNMLAEIDQALARIERGIYGICLGTGKPISKARLTARPWAPYGIEYARMVEKGLVRAGERIMPEYPEDEEEDEEDDDSDSDADSDQDFEADDGGLDHDDDEVGYDE